MSPVVATWAWVFVVPVAVVNGNLHFRTVTIVHAIAALVGFCTTEVLWIEHVRIVVEAIAVTAVSGGTPRVTEGFWAVGWITTVASCSWSGVGV